MGGGEPLPPLRDYQIDLVERASAAYRDHQRVLLQSPTGSGKTRMFVEILHRALLRGTSPIAIILHRRHLVAQVGDYLALHGFGHGFIADGYGTAPAAPIQVCSIGSLISHRRFRQFADRAERLDDDRPYLPPRLMIVDEAHHSAANSWRRVFAKFPQAKLLGCSATPTRTNGTGLHDLFDVLIQGPSIRWLENQGWLARAIVYAPPLGFDLSRLREIGGDYDEDELAQVMMSEKLLGEPVEHWTKHVASERGPQPTILFAVNVRHSQLMAERFRLAGWRARHIDGDTQDDVRREVIGGLGTGETQILCNCGLISEGLDVPVATALVVVRPTKSLTLHLQMLGRVSRPSPGKTNSIVLDHAGNCLRLGGPNQDRLWELTGWRDPPADRVCTWCNAVVPHDARICPDYGSLVVMPSVRPPAVGERKGELVRLEDSELPLWLGHPDKRNTFRGIDWAEAAGDPWRVAWRLGHVCHTRKFNWGWLWHELEDRGISEFYWPVRRFFEGGAGAYGGTEGDAAGSD